MKLQVVKCSLVGLLGVLFVTNVQGIKQEPQLCEAIGETCISYGQSNANGPRCWFLLNYPTEKCCNERGKFQSPIDIPDVKKKFIIPHKLRYSSNKFEGSFENNGIYPVLRKDTDDRVYLEGIGSEDGEQYYLQNVHFHVGPGDEERQTEHLKNGKSFDGEAHLVHVREDFGTVREAATDPQGLLIISIFLTPSNVKSFINIFDGVIGADGNLRPLQDLEGRKVFLLRFDPSFWKGIIQRIRKGKYSASDADADGDTILKDDPLSIIM